MRPRVPPTRWVARRATESSKEVNNFCTLRYNHFTLRRIGFRGWEVSCGTSGLDRIGRFWRRHLAGECVVPLCCRPGPRANHPLRRRSKRRAPLRLAPMSGVGRSHGVGAKAEGILLLPIPSRYCHSLGSLYSSTNPLSCTAAHSVSGLVWPSCGGRRQTLFWYWDESPPSSARRRAVLRCRQPRAGESTTRVRASLSSRGPPSRAERMASSAAKSPDAADDAANWKNLFLSGRRNCVFLRVWWCVWFFTRACS